MPYPAYLGNNAVHVALLTYPSEGVSVTFTADTGGSLSTMKATIPAGSSPFVANITCDACYLGGAKVTVYVGLSTTSPQVVLSKDTDFAITDLDVTDEPTDPLPASVEATFRGLTVNEVYSLGLWCHNPPMVVYTTYTATSSSPQYVYDAQPGICSTVRYLIIASPGNVHVAVSKPV